jgi:hypothetical protein
MGAAAIHDLPVRELSNLFEEVVLVDLFHLWPARWLAFRYPNVTLKTCDLTGSLERVFAGDMTVAQPTAFLDDEAVDFVISANVASQLPLLPLDWLHQTNTVDQAQRDQFGQQLVSAHFDYLKKFRGTACLICDIQRVTTQKDGVETVRQSALFDAVPPEYQTEWTWNIAPPGEIDKKQATFHIVIASILGQNSDI